jgi:CheY-like chemotaxis protein
MVRNDGTLFDLVLMDMQMPIMDGLQSTIEIRKLETLQSQAHSDNQPFSPIPICALTADAMSGARETILGAGFNAYFSKPLDFQQFETFLAQCPKRAKPKTNPLPAENNPPDHPNGEPFTTDPSIHPRNGLHPSTHQTTDSSLHHPTTTTTETLTLLTSKTTTPNPPFPPEQQTDQTITEHTGPDSQEISVSLSDPTNSTPEANNKENPSPNPHSQIPTGPQTTQPDTPTAPPSPDLETQSTKQPEPQPIFNPETLGNLTKYITPARLIDTVIPEAMVIGNDCIQTLLSIETTQREKAEAAHKMRGSLGSIGMEAIFRLTSKIEAHYEEAITNEVQDPYPDIHQIKTLFEQSQTLLDLHLETLRNTQV